MKFFITAVLAVNTMFSIGNASYFDKLKEEYSTETIHRNMGTSNQTLNFCGTDYQVLGVSIENETSNIRGYFIAAKISSDSSTNVPYSHMQTEVADGYFQIPVNAHTCYETINSAGAPEITNGTLRFQITSQTSPHDLHANAYHQYDGLPIFVKILSGN